MKRITIPFLDANIVDVTITTWHKEPGASITAGEAIAELTTDKAAFELEAPADGTLLEIFAQTKSVVPIGYTIGLIGQPGDSDPAIADDNTATMQAYRAGTTTNFTPDHEAPHSQQPLEDDAPSSPSQPLEGDAPSSPGQPLEGGAPSPPHRVSPPPSPSRIRATPKARRLAQTRNLDLTAVAAATGSELITEAILEEYLKTL